MGDIINTEYQKPIDHPDPHAKILKTKRYANKVNNNANRLLAKETNGKLQESDLEAFRLLIGREPKTGSVRCYKK